MMAFLAIIGTLALSILGRDLYAMLPKLQENIAHFAARDLPDAIRAEKVEQWLADIHDLWPSEIRRTLFALGLIYAGWVLKRQYAKLAPKPAATRGYGKAPYGGVALKTSRNLMFSAIAAVSFKLAEAGFYIARKMVFGSFLWSMIKRPRFVLGGMVAGLAGILIILVLKMVQ